MVVLIKRGRVEFVFTHPFGEAFEESAVSVMFVCGTSDGWLVFGVDHPGEKGDGLSLPKTRKVAACARNVHECRTCTCPESASTSTWNISFCVRPVRITRQHSRMVFRSIGSHTSSARVSPSNAG